MYKKRERRLCYTLGGGGSQTSIVPSGNSNMVCTLAVALVPWFRYFSNASRLLTYNKIYSFWSIGERGGIGEKRVIGKAIDRRGGL